MIGLVMEMANKSKGKIMIPEGGFQGGEIRNWVTKLLHTLTEAFKQG